MYNNKIPPKDLEQFTLACIDCALWSESVGTPPDAPDGDYDDTSLESAGYDITDIDPNSLNELRGDCRDFLTEVHDLLSPNWTMEQAGYDFWLTRNRHGAGFWDRGHEHGKTLTDIAHSYGECSLYIGDDGRIYFFNG